MADNYGLTAFPLARHIENDPAADKALRVILDFAKAVILYDAADAWQVISPNRAPVQVANAWNPEEYEFSDKSLPALYGYRKGGTPTETLADEWRVDSADVSLMWILESTPQGRQYLRAPFVNGITKSLDRAFVNGRHAAYVVDADLADPDGIKTSFASLTSSHTYTGAALNGALSGAEFSPPRVPTITLASSTGAYSTTAIVVNGTDKDGNAVSVSLTPTSANGGETLTGRGWERLAAIASVDFPAQASTAGSFTIGVGPSDDDVSTLGSLVLRHAGLVSLNLRKAGTPRLVQIRMRDATNQGEPKTYPAFLFELAIQERLTRDATVFATLGSSGDGTALIDFTLEDGSIFESAQL